MALDRFVQQSRWFILYLFYFSFLGALLGCADFPEGPGRDTGAVGAIAFSINWEDTETSKALPSRFSCGSGRDEVAFVAARIANGTHTVTLDEDWPCAAGQGTISMVPVGDGYTLTISAYRADGVAAYCLEQGGITVGPGLNDLGVLNAHPFETRGITPAPDASGVSALNASFRWDAVAGATGYRLLVSETADLSSPLDNSTIAGTSDTLASGLLQPDTQYWWAVVPIDFEGRLGVLPVDGIHRFSTLPADNPPSDDNYEPNDTLASAFDLTPHRGDPLTALDGAGIVSSDDRVDYYRIDLLTNVEWLYVECPHTYLDGDIDIVLLSSDGTLLAEGVSATDDEIIEYDLSSNGEGIFYIGVSLYGDSISNSYDLIFDYTESIPPGPPVISNLYDNLIDPFADYCVNTQGETFSGYNYNVHFDYADADGDAGELDGAFVSVNGMEWSWAEIGGDGANGTVTISYCSATAGHSLTIRMVDGGGLESNALSIDLTDYP